MNRKNFSQLITEPTRITLTTSSLIDHIYTNNPRHVRDSGVIIAGLSDHDIVYVVRKKPKIKCTSLVINTRKYDNGKDEELKTSLLNINWDPIDNVENANDKL